MKFPKKKYIYIKARKDPHKGWATRPFLSKFFPTQRMFFLKKQISTFTAQEGESFLSCCDPWLETWELTDYFYEGFTLNLKQLLKSMCNGGFLNKFQDVKPSISLVHFQRWQEDGKNLIWERPQELDHHLIILRVVSIMSKMTWT